jgi:WD40 repeat protein
MPPDIRRPWRLGCSVAFSPDGQRLVSGWDDHTVTIWDAAPGHCLETLDGHGHRVCSVAFSHDGQRLASGSSDNTASRRCLETLEGHLIKQISFDHTDSYILTNGGRMEMATATTNGPDRPDDPERHGYGEDQSCITCNGQNEHTLAAVGIPTKFLCRPRTDAMFRLYIGTCFSYRFLARCLIHFQSPPIHHLSILHFLACHQKGLGG